MIFVDFDGFSLILMDLPRSREILQISKIRATCPIPHEKLVKECWAQPTGARRRERRGTVRTPRNRIPGKAKQAPAELYLPNHPCRAIGIPTPGNESHLPTRTNARVSREGGKPEGANLLSPPSDWGSDCPETRVSGSNGPTVQGLPLILGAY